MKITIAGAGYVGLVAGACYASTGNSVCVVDSDEDKIFALKAGRVPIYEPGLLELVTQSVKAGRLRFSTDLTAAVADVDMVGIAVGTPPDQAGRADLSAVRQTAIAIAKNVSKLCMVVMKSTVPVGTGKMVCDLISQNKANPAADFEYVSNPEFLKEGTAVEDFLRPQRVVAGVESDRARELIAKLYAPFMRQGRRVHFMDIPSAELTKYACNAMLATRISFMNELARLADSLGADIQQVRLGMGSDPRIGETFLFPGLGFGGACLPKDIRALAMTGDDLGIDLEIIKAVGKVNQTQIDLLFEKILRYFQGDLSGKTFAVWGLSFKPRTDDIRNSPALMMIEKLIAAGAKVICHDPQAADNARAQLGDKVQFCDDSYELLAGADALVICTEWMDYRTPDFAKIASLLREKVIFDGRNLYQASELAQIGISYFCIGRPGYHASGDAAEIDRPQ